MTTVLFELAGGVALLLWSLRLIRTGIERAWGGELRRVLGAASGNRLYAFGIGLGVAGLVQSSTATTLMAASFVERGLVPVATGLAIVLGADVGTTLVAQALSLDLHWMTPLLLVAGVAMNLSARTARRKDLGQVLVGIGLLLVGMGMAVGASEPLRHSETLGILAGALANEPVLAVAAGALFAWLAHSSLAVVLLILSLASSGALPMTAALALVVGANLGGTLPAVTLTTADPPLARRLPIGNLMFRSVGAVLAILLLPWIPDVLPGQDATRQLANFHTGFNLAVAALFLGLTGPTARLCARLLPEAPATDQPGRPRYLDPSVTGTPAVALACAAREALRMGDVVAEMLNKSLAVLRDGDRERLQEIEHHDDVVDSLDRAIKMYLAGVSRERLDATESHRCHEILVFTTNLEHIGDIIVRNLMELASKKIRHRLTFSEEGLAEIESMHRRLAGNLSLALGVFLSGDIKAARQLVAEKDEFRYLERKAAENHMNRLRSGQIESIESSSLQLDVLRDLKRIHAHISSAAYPILEAAGELNRSRLRSEPKAAQSGLEAVPKTS